jgi:phosphoserine phosphatase
MGLSREYLYSRAEQYVEDRIERFGNPVVLRAIREAQSVGTPVYLATASLDPIAHAVTRQLGFTGVVCARLRYCGKNKLCAGVFAWDTTGKKLKNLQTIVPLLLLQHATVYTDNWEDVDLLRVAKCVYFYGERQDLPSLTSREIHKITFLARVGKRRTNECN